MEVDNTMVRSPGLEAGFSRYQRKKRLFLICLVPVLALSALVSLGSGSADIPLAEICRILWSDITGGAYDPEGPGGFILKEFRLPRVLMGILTGMALGCAGSVMQVVLRNPLADPYILGISSAAGFGASLAIVAGIGFLPGAYMVMGNAFVFSLLSSGMILAISGRHGASPQAMILTGLALLFFFQAMTTMLQYFGDADAVKAAVFWTVGDLARAGWDNTAMAGPVVAAGVTLLWQRSGDLNLLNTGDETAHSLGIRVGRLRVFTMVVSAVMIAGIVSFTGTIGFVGLVAPHLVRMVAGNDNTILIPASGLAGATLLVLADAGARTIFSPVILPVGTVTAFLGVPLFIFLIIRKNRGGS